MPHLPALYQWNDIVGKRFPQMSKPMAACLALWSLGMIVARSCSLTAVAWAWVPILKEKFYTLRERLRDLTGAGYTHIALNSGYGHPERLEEWAEVFEGV